MYGINQYAVFSLEVGIFAWRKIAFWNYLFILSAWVPFISQVIPLIYFWGEDKSLNYIL